MCTPEAAIASAVISAGASIYQGNTMAKIDQINRQRAKAEADIRNAQLEEEKKIAKINAQIEEDNRRKAYLRNISSVRAYQRGKDSQSFEAFLSAEEDAFRLDVDNLRLGGRIERGRLATQISVNTAASSLPDLSGFYKTSGYLNAAGSLAQGGFNYYNASVPTNSPSTTTTTTTYKPGSYQAQTSGGTFNYYNNKSYK